MRLLLTIALFIFMLPTAFGQQTFKDLDAFGKFILKTINDRDYEGFRTTLITEEEYDVMMHRTAFRSDEEKESILASKDKHLYSINFENLAEFKAIDFETLILKGIDFIVTTDANGIKYCADFKIEVLDGEIDRVISFDRVILTDNGWKSVGSFTIKLED